MKKTLKYGFGRRLKQHFQFFSIFRLVWLESSYIPKISLLACLILEIPVKMTLTLEFGRRPQHTSNFVSIFILVMIILSDILKISPLSCLFLEKAMKKTLTLGFGRRPQQHFQFFLNISSILVRIKLHTKFQPPRLLNSGYIY